MNEEMAPGEHEVTEDDPAMIEREINAGDPPAEAAPPADPAPAPAAAAPATVHIDGKDVPIEQVLSAYRGSQGAQHEAQEQTRRTEQLSRVIADRVHRGSEAPDPVAEPGPPPQPVPQVDEVEIPQTLPQAQRIEEYLLLNEVTGLKATYGEFDQDAVFETMVEREIDDVETALFVTRGQAASRAEGAALADSAADGVAGSAGAEPPSSSALTETTTPDVEGKSWGQIEREAASDVSRRGASILS